MKKTVLTVLITLLLTLGLLASVVAYELHDGRWMYQHAQYLMHRYAQGDPDVRFPGITSMVYMHCNEVWSSGNWKLAVIDWLSFIWLRKTDTAIEPEYYYNPNVKEQ